MPASYSQARNGHSLFPLFPFQRVIPFS
jgi:hypothetical protein